MDIKYFDAITPKQISKEVIKFCKKICYKSTPIYVTVSPKEMTKINNCFLNVQKYIENFGGNYLNGWAIWLHPNCMIEAEAHCVYQDIENNIIDITPHKNNISQILFLPDNSIVYEGFGINNIRQNLTKSKLIDDCINAWNEIYEILYKGKNKYIHGKIILNENDSSRYMILNNFIKENLTKFYATLKLKPNSECICGSGLKFIDCCKKIKSIYQ